MQEESLCFTPLSEMAKMIRSGMVSPLEVLDSVLNLVERLNPIINAYCTLVIDEARREARHAEEAIVAHRDLGPLHGIPFSVKDMISTKGIRTTFGSKIYGGLVPKEDSIVVERLKAAGAIILGKTNTSEFGYKAVTDNAIFGVTRNPWDITKTPGGSSGGGAAAVACGMSPIAIGTDAGGSVRIPSSFCGTLGFKPSRGRIPIYPVLSGWENLEDRLLHMGLLTRTVDDGVLVMEVIGGPDYRDAKSMGLGKPIYRKEARGDIRGLRVAWTTDFGGTVVATDVKDVVSSAVSSFLKLGCEVEERSINFPPLHEAFRLLFAVDSAEALRGRWETLKDVLDPPLARLVAMGQKATAQDYVRAANQCHLLWNHLKEVFDNYDLLLTPTVPVAPFDLRVDWPREIEGNEVHPLNYLGFTYPFNITGQPAASVPCGFNEAGLPVGLQIVGRQFEDIMVLRAAKAFEEVRPWDRKRPGIRSN